jgi:hypothetical protein
MTRKFAIRQGVARLLFHYMRTKDEYLRYLGDMAGSCSFPLPRLIPVPRRARQNPEALSSYQILDPHFPYDHCYPEFAAKV